MHRTHGTGEYRREDFRALGENVILEAGILVFHPENIVIGNDVYVGHRAILKGYHQGEMRIGDGTWIGQMCFLHSAGNITIGRNVGIGPGVMVLTSAHAEEGRGKPILHSRIDFAPVLVEDDADLGVGSILLPGVTVGKGAQVGAGAVVAESVEPYAVVAGVPARRLRYR
jgi:acetyltransferase-like isoleucine patch superfamily enzyme